MALTESSKRAVPTTWRHTRVPLTTQPSTPHLVNSSTKVSDALSWKCDEDASGSILSSHHVLPTREMVESIPVGEEDNGGAKEGPQVLPCQVVPKGGKRELPHTGKRDTHRRVQMGT